MNCVCQILIIITTTFLLRVNFSCQMLIGISKKRTCQIHHKIKYTLKSKTFDLFSYDIISSPNFYSICLKERNCANNSRCYCATSYFTFHDRWCGNTCWSFKWISKELERIFSNDYRTLRACDNGKTWENANRDTGYS